MPSAAQLKTIKPYLEDVEPNDTGELGMHCPFHDDGVRSASYNMETGLWYCHACEQGGTTKQLIDGIKKMGGSDVSRSTARQDEESATGDRKTVDEEAVRGWANALFSTDHRDRLEEIKERRGLTEDTLLRYQIGWDQRARAYTIPIRDVDGFICNVRRYQFDVPDERRKIWSINGMGTPTLYPVDQLEFDEVIVCEGEWDALLTIQNGFAAVTRTGAADVWKSSWSNEFRNKRVYVCHDMDVKGQKANDKVSKALTDFAAQVEVVHLPYDVTEKHGKDLSDFWLSGNTPIDLYMLFPLEPALRDEDHKPELVDVSVLDSFDSSLSGREVRMRVTITGKRNPTFLIPREIDYSCTQDAGIKCNFCPMNDMGGAATRTVQNNDPTVMEMMGATKPQLLEILRVFIGAQKCGVLDTEVVEHMSVEELFVRPSVDAGSAIGGGADHTNRKIVSVGRHDSLPNNTVEVVGSIFPNPRGQHNEFQAWELNKTETSIDRFVMTDDVDDRLKEFRPGRRQSPMDKLREIATDLEQHVTKIYGRQAMHILFDLVFHSAISFQFGGVYVHRGWVEALVVGDTRTGKSEVAGKLITHYNAGEMISCESATFAGIVGGLQQFGSGKEWEVSWGAIPLNDRRLVALDEISGMTTEQISQMSSIRSTGEAQLTKIRSERAWARTRLIWMGNPRNGRLADYTYGIYALPGLIGNNEDIARFDVAMSVATDDVDPAEINRMHVEEYDPTFSQQDYQDLLLWAWSRKAEQIIFAEGAEAAVFDAALELGKRYVETPPLVQGANVRVKVARLAVAVATRLYSSDEEGEHVLVRPEHVQAAVELMDELYDNNSFGYAEHSREQIRDIEEASKNYDKAKSYVVGYKYLTKFLRNTRGSFRRQDLEDMMSMSREEAIACINNLWTMRMVSRQGANVKILPLLHQILREVRD